MNIHKMSNKQSAKQYAYHIKINNLFLSYPHNTSQSSLSNREPPPDAHAQWALGPIHLDIKQGDKIAILGNSASGKTSFLHALQEAIDYPNKFNAFPSHDTLSPPPSANDTENQYYGSICVDNTNKDTHHLQCLSIFQESQAVFNPMRNVFSSFKNLVHSKKYPHTHMLSKKDILSYLAQVGLGDEYDILKKYPHQLSGGMAQRTMIALTLAMQADLILADEVTSSLDMHHEKIIIDLILKSFDTVLMVSHRLHTISYGFNRVIFFADGNIIFDGKYKDFLKVQNPLIQSYIDNLSWIQEKSAYVNPNTEEFFNE